MSVRFFLTQYQSSKTLEKPPHVVQEYCFENGLCSIGSHNANHLILDGLAPEQLVFIKDEDCLLLINKAPGTHFNGKTLLPEATQSINQRDQIEIGDYCISFQTETNQPLPARSFAEVLQNLQNEEDRYYFSVHGKTQNGQKLFLDAAQSSLGLDKEEYFFLSYDETQPTLGRLIKNWNGVEFQPTKSPSFFLNNRFIKSNIKLRDGDQISFGRKRKNSSFLVFHEPSLIKAIETFFKSDQSSEARVEEEVKSPSQVNSASKFNRLELSLLGLIAIVSLVLILITLEITLT